MAKKKNAAKKEVPVIRKCGTMGIHYQQLEEFPAFRQALVDLEQTTHQRLASRAVIPTKKLTIQVVVHIVYNKTAENISDAQIKSQIDILNKDFNATNTDKSKVPAVWKGLVASTNLSFALAKKDPSGKKTTGITRTKTTKVSFSDNDGVKYKSRGGVNAWPTDRYLNMWVCNLANGLLGYAQFPGGPVATDGIVILHSAFGTKGTATAPFNKGRTTTHEVGHFLNLRHIWGDDPQCAGSDLVADTPNQQTPNYGTPSFPHVSCSNGPNGDMFMNYMDYVDDTAMFMFTTEQVARMRTTLDGPRSSLGV